MMTPEITALALAGLLQAVQYVLMAVPINIELGSNYTMSARDSDPARPISPKAGRLKRALDNHFEGLILFTLAVVVVQLSGSNSGFTAACAWLYLLARILYIPAYALALNPWRSVVWAVGFLATIAMILAALF
jgi:uncharacterized MAPEG superfamily protein